MKEQFVTYEIALILKEKGFDEECFGWWFVDEEMLIIEKSKKAISDNIAQAPLWQQAFAWCLRKLEEINPEPYNRNWCYGLSIDGSCFLDFGHGDYCKDFKTKEEAIEHALTLI